MAARANSPLGRRIQARMMRAIGLSAFLPVFCLGRHRHRRPGGAGGFAVWGRASSHPMLNLAFFRTPSFSAGVGSNGLALFGLVGSLFVLTQFLQFNLGYPALQAGVRMLSIAGVLAIRTQRRLGRVVMRLNVWIKSRMVFT